jgi:hypothetical protein
LSDDESIQSYSDTFERVCEITESSANDSSPYIFKRAGAALADLRREAILKISKTSFSSLRS